MTIDWTKPVVFILDEKPVRVLCTDRPGKFPVVLLNECGVLFTATLFGCLSGEAKPSFKNAPRKISQWYNRYLVVGKNSFLLVNEDFPTKEAAAQCAQANVYDQIEITLELP